MTARWFLYLLACDNDYLYCGITTDVSRRFEQHRQGRGARFTRSNRPHTILGVEPFADRGSATRAEIALKRRTREQKMAWGRDHPWR